MPLLASLCLPHSSDLAELGTAQDCCEKVQVIGGNGGCAFNIGASYHENGSVVNRIEVWRGDRSHPFLHGIKIVMSDGQSDVRGNSKHGTWSCLDIPAGVTVRELTLYGGSGVGLVEGIHIKLSNGSKMREIARQENELVINVGSGIPVGARGKSGCDLDALGFFFLKPIESIKFKGGATLRK